MPVYREKNRKKWTKDGRSYYFKCQYKDKYGNIKTKYSPYYMTSKEAKEQEALFVNNTIYTDEVEANPSFEKVYNEWLQFKKQKVKSSTYYCIVTKIHSRTIDYFKNYKLHDIKINVLLEWREKLINEDLSNEHKNVIIGYMQEILNYAVNYYNFDVKVSNRLFKIKIENVTNKKEELDNFWTYEDFKKFIAVVDNDFDYLMFNFLYFTGLRISEMIALNWNDIDLDDKKLRVNKTFTIKTFNDSYEITSPKTQNSIRTIDLDDNLVNLLKKHKNEEMKIINFNNNMFVFGNVDHVAETTFRRHLNYYINKSGVKSITPHGLRHSHVSLLIDLGCDSRDVAQRIGDTVSMVEKTYYHMFPEKKKETIDKLNNLK